jgi:hypothetical protein
MKVWLLEVVSIGHGTGGDKLFEETSQINRYGIVPYHDQCWEKVATPSLIFHETIV